MVAVLWYDKTPPPAAAQELQQSTTLTLLPASPVIAVGETVAVAVMVNDVTDLWGADFFLDFDATYVEVVDADSALPGVQIAHGGFLQPPLTMGSNTVDNANGTIWYGATETNPTLPVSGSGPIAVITFRGPAVGYSPVTFRYSFLTDKDGGSIAHSSVDGGVTVQDVPAATQTPTLEPTPTATPWVYVGGLAAGRVSGSDPALAGESPDGGRRWWPPVLVGVAAAAYLGRVVRRRCR